MKVGIIGLNEGNGHPFSFSSIINGYDRQAMKAAGWKVILDYLEVRDPSEFGFNDINVTHAWTQNPELTKQLCEACFIKNEVKNLSDLAEQVDAVIIARDDYESHKKIAASFLEKNLPVFIDKPLSINQDELRYFKPFLENGTLMSCSAMRYAKELDDFHKNGAEYGDLPLIRAIGPLSWEKYGIHLLEAMLPTISSPPHSVISLSKNHDAIALSMKNGTLFQIDTLATLLSASQVPFQIEIWGTEKQTMVTIQDNFSMFRRALWHFFNMIDTGVPAISPHSTLILMKVLIAGQRSQQENREVFVDEIII